MFHGTHDGLQNPSTPFIGPVVQDVAEKVRFRVDDWLCVVEKIVRHPTELGLEIHMERFFPNINIALEVLYHKV